MTDDAVWINRYRCPRCDAPLTEVIGGYECAELSTGVGGCGYFKAPLAEGDDE
jgi:hypothetical protein